MADEITRRQIAKAFKVPGYLIGLEPTRWERFVLRLPAPLRRLIWR